MPGIYVEFAGMKHLGESCKEISSSIKGIRTDFYHTISRLDWNVRFQSDIDTQAKILSKKMDSCSHTLLLYQHFINDAYDKYRQLDEMLYKEVNAGESLTDPLNESQHDYGKQLWEFIKSIFHVIDEGTEGKRIPFYGILSYIDSCYKFFNGDKRGLTGAKDLFYLGDKSIDLWKGLYKYLKHRYPDAGNLFSIANQKKVAGLGIVGSSLGLIGYYFGAVDTIYNTDDMGSAGIAGELLGGGEYGVDIWKDIETLKHVGDASETGIYSPLTIYAAIAKGYLSAAAQGFKSYDKYIADDIWDLGDTASTGIEIGVSGLYSMIDALTFGVISEEVAGVSAEQISEGLENWAGNIGTDAGNYIVNNPKLHDAYNHSNSVGQAAIIFYASMKSLWM